MKQRSTKLIALLLAFTSLTMGLASCEKDSNDQDPTPASIEGLWVGTYAIDGQPQWGLQYYSLIIKPDGTVINDTKGLNVQYLAIGNWTLTGNTFTCNTEVVYGSSFNMGSTQTHTATFDRTTGTIINGTWTDVDTPGHNTGTFTVTKVK